MTEYDPDLVTRFLHEYQDRGMMKWNGFYLSDHTSKFNKMAKSDQVKRERKHSEQMSNYEIDKIINQAVIKKQTIIVELNIRNLNDDIPEFIEGKIIGFIDNKLFVGNSEVVLTEIYSIKIKKQ
ncbi:hypothetical protein [Companilactobacillus keshanensis]|uniref:DNA-directed RNA polymerase beta subunit n=1 Tax=Companilactobacillus keshanensis TaxID=2486003 RepID=A0ABW4BRP4_9LACO|nr:hypothetical protein [Companilactobacillus keshanensis]